MDIEDCHYDEVYAVLLKNNAGLSFDALFNQCKLFEDKTDMSRCLHRASQQGNVAKKNNIYRLTTEKYKEMTGNEPPAEEVAPVAPVVDPVTEEIKKLLPKIPVTAPVADVPSFAEVKPVGKVVRIAAKKTEVPKAPEPVEIPFGDLQRSKALGGAALALYKLRNEEYPWLNLSELSEWTGSSAVVLSQRMSVLIDRRYIEKDISLGIRRPRFKWTGNYRYPFDVWKNTDDGLVKYTLLEWSTRSPKNGKCKAIPPDEIKNISNSQFAVPVSDNNSAAIADTIVRNLGTQASSENNQPSLSFIDFQISIHLAQIANLENIKRTLTA